MWLLKNVLIFNIHTQLPPQLKANRTGKMEDDDLFISIEPPLTLSPNAKRSLELAKQKTLQSSFLNGTPNKNHKGNQEEDITNLDVLERAWIDEQKSVKPTELPLSACLVKLWSERGDFSKFRASTLLQDGSNDRSTEEIESIVEEDLGANLKDLETEDTKEKDKEERNENEKNEKVDSDTKAEIMSIEDMVQVRRNMLDKLNIAQNSLYFSHALVSLLINSTKLGNDAPSANSARAGSAAASAKFGLDALGSGGAANAASTSRSVTGAAQMGSAAALEAELGIEPYIFGASLIEAFRRDLERSGDEDEADEQLSAGHDDEEEDAEERGKEQSKIMKEDSKLLDEEVEDHARELVELIEGKKEGIRSAIDILRKGAKTIQPDNEGAGREKVRWQALMLARRAGWNLTPDKPIRGTAAKKAELLQDFGPLKRDEPARDAWIGYAVPETSSRYTRQALAYLSHSSTEGNTPADALLFASRPGKRLKVQVLIGEEIWTSDGEKDGADLENDRSLDGLLRQAQSEYVDEELFDSIMAESRILSIAGLCSVSIDDEDQVTVDLNSFTKLRFIRQATSVDDEEIEADESKVQHSSPIIQGILSILRLSLFRRYRQRAGMGIEKVSSEKSENDEIKAPLLQPLLGLIHYASFVAHLRIKLLLLAKLNEDIQVEMNLFERIGNLRSWLKMFLQRTDGAGDMTAIRKLGGSSTISHQGRPLAYISFNYPSQISLTLPLKKLTDGSGTGVHLSSVDLTSLDGILSKELERISRYS